MKKVLPLIVATLALGFQTTFAGPGPESKNKPQFQFTSVDLTQNSWDYAYMHFNVNDLNTGESLDIPSFLVQYEVKDKTGSVVASGNGLYMNVMDNKLGSEEDYTIVVSTQINGQKVSKSICKKASPKKFAMKVDAAALESGSLAANDLNYSFTRPKYSNHAVEENVQIAPTDMYVNVALNNTNYKIQVGPNHTNLTDQADYQALKNDLNKLTAEGKSAPMSIEPTLNFKGEMYTDNQSYYQVTASGITPVSTLDQVADK